GPLGILVSVVVGVPVGSAKRTRGQPSRGKSSRKYSGVGGSGMAPTDIRVLSRPRAARSSGSVLWLGPAARSCGEIQRLGPAARSSGSIGGSGILGAEVEVGPGGRAGLRLRTPRRREGRVDDGEVVPGRVVFGGRHRFEGGVRDAQGAGTRRELAAL